MPNGEIKYERVIDKTVVGDLEVALIVWPDPYYNQVQYSTHLKRIDIEGYFLGNYFEQKVDAIEDYVKRIKRISKEG